MKTSKKFLDGLGLSFLWKKISSVLDKKANSEDIDRFLAGIDKTETLKGLLDQLEKKILNQANVVDLVLDAAQYDNIIAADGLIRGDLDRYEVTCNLSRTKFKTITNNLKSFRIQNSDGTRSTLFDVTFIMPTYNVFCGYTFNKLNDTQFGIGYVTVSYKDEYTLRLTSIRSTMLID